MENRDSGVAQKVADSASLSEASTRAGVPASNSALSLTMCGRAAVTVRVTEAPWELEDTVLTVPVSPDGVVGELGVELDRVQSGVKSGIGEVVASRPDKLRCDEAVVVTVGSNPERRIIAVTAHDVSTTQASVAGAGRAAIAAVHRADRLGVERLALPLIGIGPGALETEPVARVMLNAVTVARPQRLREVTFVVRDQSVAALLQAVVRTRGQRLANDLPSGADRLNVEAEVTALAEMLLMVDVEPPLVVGVLGGWGSGKSFIMYLLRKRMAELRALAAADDSPYVGHVYPVRFDAWTYAKTDLWASLLQTIFRQVSTQLELERRIDGHPERARAGNPV